MIRTTSPKFVIALTDHAPSSSHHVKSLEELAARRLRRLGACNGVVAFSLDLTFMFIFTL
ncbi:MAG: hypothetical protein ACREQ2_08555 [Candidatus Binatia bacterium]